MGHHQCIFMIVKGAAFKNLFPVWHDDTRQFSSYVAFAYTLSELLCCAKIEQSRSECAAVITVICTQMILTNSWFENFIQLCNLKKII